MTLRRTEYHRIHGTNGGRLNVTPVSTWRRLGPIVSSDIVKMGAAFDVVWKQ